MEGGLCRCRIQTRTRHLWRLKIKTQRSPVFTDLLDPLQTKDIDCWLSHSQALQVPEGRLLSRNTKISPSSLLTHGASGATCPTRHPADRRQHWVSCGAMRTANGTGLRNLIRRFQTGQLVRPGLLHQSHTSPDAHDHTSTTGWSASSQGTRWSRLFTLTRLCPFPQFAV